MGIHNKRARTIQVKTDNKMVSVSIELVPVENFGIALARVQPYSGEPYSVHCGNKSELVFLTAED